MENTHKKNILFSFLLISLTIHIHSAEQNNLNSNTITLPSQEMGEGWVRAFIKITGGITQNGSLGSNNVTYTVPDNCIRFLNPRTIHDTQPFLRELPYYPTHDNSIPSLNILSHTPWHLRSCTHTTSEPRIIKSQHSHRLPILNPITQMPIPDDRNIADLATNDPAILASNNNSEHSDIEPQVATILNLISGNSNTHTDSKNTTEETTNNNLSAEESISPIKENQTEEHNDDSYLNNNIDLDETKKTSKKRSASKKRKKITLNVTEQQAEQEKRKVQAENDRQAALLRTQREQEKKEAEQQAKQALQKEKEKASQTVAKPIKTQPKTTKKNTSDNSLSEITHHALFNKLILLLQSESADNLRQNSDIHTCLEQLRKDWTYYTIKNDRQLQATLSSPFKQLIELLEQKKLFTPGVKLAKFLKTIQEKEEKENEYPLDPQLIACKNEIEKLIDAGSKINSLTDLQEKKQRWIDFFHSMEKNQYSYVVHIGINDPHFKTHYSTSLEKYINSFLSCQLTSDDVQNHNNIFELLQNLEILNTFNTTKSSSIEYKIQQRIAALQKRDDSQLSSAIETQTLDNSASAYSEKETADISLLQKLNLENEPIVSASYSQYLQKMIDILNKFKEEKQLNPTLTFNDPVVLQFAEKFSNNPQLCKGETKEDNQLLAILISLLHAHTNIRFSNPQKQIGSTCQKNESIIDQKLNNSVTQPVVKKINTLSCESESSTSSTDLKTPKELKKILNNGISLLEKGQGEVFKIVGVKKAIKAIKEEHIQYPETAQFMTLLQTKISYNWPATILKECRKYPQLYDLFFHAININSAPILEQPSTSDRSSRNQEIMKQVQKALGNTNDSFPIQTIILDQHPIKQLYDMLQSKPASVSNCPAMTSHDLKKLINDSNIQNIIKKTIISDEERAAIVYVYYILNSNASTEEFEEEKQNLYKSLISEGELGSEEYQAPKPTLPLENVTTGLKKCISDLSPSSLPLFLSYVWDYYLYTQYNKPIDTSIQFSPDTVTKYFDPYNKNHIAHILGYIHAIPNLNIKEIKNLYKIYLETSFDNELNTDTYLHKQTVCKHVVSIIDQKMYNEFSCNPSIETCKNLCQWLNNPKRSRPCIKIDNTANITLAWYAPFSFNLSQPLTDTTFTADILSHFSIYLEYVASELNLDEQNTIHPLKQIRDLTHQGIVICKYISSYKDMPCDKEKELLTEISKKIKKINEGTSWNKSDCTTLLNKYYASKLNILTMWIKEISTKTPTTTELLTFSLLIDSINSEIKHKTGDQVIHTELFLKAT